ncbi:CAAX amino protease [Ktedonobacter robiniae]|uniref:CAAX amino protease n=2 Tax=Ktedonobacter robiniae TaxID=2778365 RepID=A0ABQ3V4F8_9CHLR|nr:CAAX amino protease [Ktedonobacter robiniae]
MSSDASALDVLGVILLGSCGPAIAALIMSAVVEGKAGVLLLLRRIIRVRAGIQWYMLALFLPIVASVVYYLPLGPLDVLKHLFSTQGALGLAFYIVAVPGGMVLGSPLGEEVGWRGFALHRLQRRMGPLASSLLLALLWACWHLPLAAFTVWGAQFRVIGLLPGFILYILTVAGYTIVMTWLFNNTRGSIFLAILFHSAVDTVPTLFFVAYPQLNNKLGATGASSNGSMSAILVSLAGVGAWLVIVGIILVATRGRLSYKPGLEKDVQPSIDEPVVDDEMVASR